MFGFLGLISIIFALLINKDEKKYDWLIKPIGLNSTKFALYFYSILGVLLVFGSLSSNSYVSGFIIPILTITFLALMSIIMLIIKSGRKENVS